MPTIYVVMLSAICLFLTACKGVNTDNENLSSVIDSSSSTSTSTSTPSQISEPVRAATVPLEPNDVTILFPLPQAISDLGALISVTDLKDVDGEPVFDRASFEQMLALAESSVSQIGSRKIRLSSSARPFADWKIAGIRFDPSAPGGSEALIDIFGSRPQLRLVIQPVSSSNQRVVVHDVAIHLIFEYVDSIEASAPGVIGRAVPDTERSESIIAGLTAIKSACEQLGISTSGELSVHPGLTSNNGRQIAVLIEQFLSAHLHGSRFNSGAIMGLDNGGPEPWIFLSMNRDLNSGQFQPVPSPGLGPINSGQFAQMISFIDQPNVQPAPGTTNRNVLSADLRTPLPTRRGVSTSPLFSNGQLADQAHAGINDSGQPIFDQQLTNGDIVDWVANPEQSHFFNTDCISCHTESTRRIILNIPRSEFAFGLQSVTPPAQLDTMPTNRWNVRNLGWFRSKATISMRTKNETREVVEFINKNF